MSILSPQMALSMLEAVDGAASGGVRGEVLRPARAERRVTT
jgi:hypothetical protein